ncbi:MAG TPA: YidC/Oxa1 family insertase periplasmic-domain containing protein, partial [Longimicrobium sp.]|nr:YidC/Oxa1 family insertase periplasmic-domain containing protein [Longimicrobium sp.]
YRFSTRGGALEQGELLRFRSYTDTGSNVRLVPRGAAGVLASRVTADGRTLDLAAADCQPSAPRLDLAAGSAPARLVFTCPAGTVTYTFRPDRYLIDVEGRVSGVTAGEVATSLGTGLAPHDAPEHAAERELSLVGWTGERIERLYLRKASGIDTLEGGPARWAGFRDRYFFLAVINQDSAAFRHVVARDIADETYVAEGKTVRSPRAQAYGVRPLGPGGTFRYQAYLGPLEHSQLEAAGHELEEVNPYGYRWLRPVIRPIAAAVLWVLRELHDGLGIAYGWVLIIFGVMMRLVTWPLNARAMRAQMKNMAVQPQMQARMKEIQGKYANDPRKQQEEMMKMYQELGVNPLSMMSGCLPLLIPMPVLITLFFVFQGAVEFRGTPFAWLPDLSLKDPWYVLPVFLVVSMFGLQWISTKMSGMEDNPQTRMMLYTMPLMMGIFFWWMPSGLNLYYATTNVASLPQQLLIARERRRATEAQKAKDLAAKKAAGRPAGVKPGAPKRRN